jgi:hypothetical protein
MSQVLEADVVCGVRRKAVTKLAGRKRRLVLETPYVARGRAVVVHVEASGLKLREKGQRTSLEISWAQVYNRAAEIAAEHARQQARERKRGR